MFFTQPLFWAFGGTRTHDIRYYRYRSVAAETRRRLISSDGRIWTCVNQANLSTPYQGEGIRHCFGPFVLSVTRPSKETWGFRCFWLQLVLPIFSVSTITVLSSRYFFPQCQRTMCVFEQMMVIETTSSKWRSDALTVVLHLRVWASGGIQTHVIPGWKPSAIIS